MQNRIYKFRAWDKKIKKMWWNVQNAYDGQENHQNPDKEDDNCDYSFYSCNFGDALKDDDYVVMQFTGLHDKNGKEIYEGDIIKFWYSAGGDEQGTPNAIGEVVFGNEHYEGWSVYAKDKSPVLMGKGSIYEIIGNIYENSELLK